ncbi:hypothetical protein SLS63_011226 [Diaporthe eres]|uniref:Major facilitator superfamily (MFS) profile domain-containing protein n=1 Tax=Diaporthe eres TaxID=83184 RepID=A0ABR1NUP6_DIAER
MSKEISSIMSHGSPTPTGEKTIDGQLIDPNRPSLDKIRAFTKAEARAANIAEHEQTFRHALSANKKAVFWSLVISMAIVMEGYDTALMPQFYGYPSFQKQYGEFFPDIGEWSLTGAWQAGLSNAQAIGVILGGFINGWASAMFGYKKMMLVALFWINSTIFIVFFAPTIYVLLIGQFLCGLGWGVFATTGPAYASEVCPLALRGYLTVYNNLCWAMGQLIANGVLKALVNNSSEWSYRIPFAVQWAWPLPLFVLVSFSPESPWWLAKKERYGDAAISLHRLSNRTESDVQNSLAQIVYTIRLEKARIARSKEKAAAARPASARNNTASQTHHSNSWLARFTRHRELQSGSTYRDCFRGLDRRRTEICCVAFAGQMLSGAQFAYGPSYFYLQAGMSVDDAYKLAVVSPALAFIGTVSSWVLLTYFGRRIIYLCGISGMTVVLCLIAIISVATHSSAGLWVQAALCLVWQLVYSLTLGPITYSIIAETSAMHLRAKTVVLARNTYNVVTVASLVIEPYLINPTELDLEGKTAFFWAATAALTTVWAYFRLPEVKDRTYEELDVLFAKKLSARKFKSAEVHVYEDSEYQIFLD